LLFFPELHRHNKGRIAALELLTKLKINACRTASGMQASLRGALTSREIAKCVEYCLKPGKTASPEKWPNALFKTMSDEDFFDCASVGE